MPGKAPANTDRGPSLTAGRAIAPRAAPHRRKSGRPLRVTGEGGPAGGQDTARSNLV